MKRYTLAELEQLPTLHQGQTDDLKIETKTMRIWLSRMTKEDGIPYDNQITVEVFNPERKPFGKWETVEQYEAKPLTINCGGTCAFCNTKSIHYGIENGNFTYYCTKCKKTIDKKFVQ